MSELLRSDVPGSLRPMMLLISDDLHWQSFGNMNHTKRTGLPAFDQIFGQPLFTYLSAHSADAERFDNAMTSYSGVAIDALVQAYDFRRLRCLVAFAVEELLGQFVARYRGQAHPGSVRELESSAGPNRDHGAAVRVLDLALRLLS